MGPSFYELSQNCQNFSILKNRPLYSEFQNDSGIIILAQENSSSLVKRKLETCFVEILVSDNDSIQVSSKNWVDSIECNFRIIRVLTSIAALIVWSSHRQTVPSIGLACPEAVGEWEYKQPKDKFLRLALPWTSTSANWQLQSCFGDASIVLRLRCR